MAARPSLTAVVAGLPVVRDWHTWHSQLGAQQALRELNTVPASSRRFDARGRTRRRDDSVVIS